jgi:hypothetical protein
MTTELHLARGIVRGRVHADQEHALLRNVELALREDRRQRRIAQRNHRTR